MITERRLEEDCDSNKDNTFSRGEEISYMSKTRDSKDPLEAALKNAESLIVFTPQEQAQFDAMPLLDASQGKSLDQINRESLEQLAQ